MLGVLLLTGLIAAPLGSAVLFLPARDAARRQAGTWAASRRFILALVGIWLPLTRRWKAETLSEPLDADDAVELPVHVVELADVARPYDLAITVAEHQLIAGARCLRTG